MVLNPYFLNGLIACFILFEASSISLIDATDSFSMFTLINLTAIILGITGLVLTLLERAKIAVLYSGLFLGILLPTLNILYDQADLRLAIFSLPLAYILELAVACHSVNNRTHGIFSVLLLAGLLIPMTHSPINLHSESIGIQITLTLIIGVTGFIFLVLYSWNKNKAYLLTNEKRLIDKISQLIDIFSTQKKSEETVHEGLSSFVNRVLPSLEFEDCVIYLLDSDTNVLHQQLAYGAKNTADSTGVINPLAIPVGQGIVGSVAASGKPELIGNTSLDERYIPDDKMRYSELCVPIFADNKVIGVIDSEHSAKNFFNEIHLYLLQIIATQCATKITEFQHQKIYNQSIQLEVQTTKLQETDLIKSRFISNLSHDLKTPLTLILGPSNELAKQKNSPEIAALIADIKKNGNELKQVIDELLTLNEVNFLAQHTSITTFDVGVLMMNWSEQFAHRAVNKNIKLKVAGSPTLLIAADEKKLALIVFSLFDRALKTSETGSLIQISYSIENDLFQWKIMYPKASSSQAKPAQNELDIIGQLIQDLAGEIDHVIDNDLITTTIRLTLHQSTSSNTKNPHNTLHEREDLHEKPIVLVIEDHHELRAFIQSSLEEDFICVSTEKGEDGIEFAKKFIPDLIITDLMLPGISGEEVCLAIQNDEQINHIPIVVLSAKSMTMDRVELYRLGAENYLTKPFELDELKAVIRNTIHQREVLKRSFKARFNAVEQQEENDPFLLKTIAIINSNIADSQFNIASLTHELKIGRTQFQRKIKMLTDMTPVEFLRNVRIKKARALILTSETTISEIAYAVGFNNLSYFTRAYKRTFNELPSVTMEQKSGIKQ